MNREMERALDLDGEKLRQLTGEDHGPHRLPPDFAQIAKGRPLVEVIERIARAIHRERHPLAKDEDRYWKIYIPEAKAAIAALED